MRLLGLSIVTIVCCTVSVFATEVDVQCYSNSFRDLCTESYKNMCNGNGTDSEIWLIYRTFLEHFVVEPCCSLWMLMPNYHPWFFSILGSTAVGLSGIFPLMVIPLDGGDNLKSGGM